MAPLRLLQVTPGHYTCSGYTVRYERRCWRIYSGGALLTVTTSFLSARLLLRRFMTGCEE